MNERTILYQRQIDNPVSLMNSSLCSPEMSRLFETLGKPAVIKVVDLWGRQRPDEYCRRKEHRVKRMFKTQGIGFLPENPIYVVFMPYGSANPGVGLPIIADGHHRARFAPVFNIYEIPSLVLPAEWIADSLNISPLELNKTLSDQITDALSALSRVKTTIAIPGFVNKLDLGLQI